MLHDTEFFELDASNIAAFRRRKYNDISQAGGLIIYVMHR